jgi:hypothetical protein
MEQFSADEPGDQGKTRKNDIIISKNKKEA